MAVPYDFTEIEARWRQHWSATRLTQVDLDTASPGDVFYNLVEFPYPSAEGLHVGHVFRYSGVDVFGRYQRMRGKQVFQPMGFDAFGIHTENYALRVNENPATLTARTTRRFREQLEKTGIAWAWERVIDTSDPEYYRWTQWILTRLFKAGLMYQDEAPVIWCPSCMTVLAAEQTENDGTSCERCGTAVTTRVMRQWFLRITRYADELLEGLDALEWPDHAKRLQEQWIGRSTGCEISFGDLTVFTTRPDTLPAVTFIAVPPGHPEVGTTKPHPVSGEPIPVVAADYVVAVYGTGAVMGVPAHDERDRAHAAEHGLAYSDAELLDWSVAATFGVPAVRYRLRDWLISRQRYWGPPIPIIHCEDCGPVAVPDDQLPVVLPEIDDFRPTGTDQSPLAAHAEWVATTCPECGGAAQRETDVSDTFFDSSWYYLRYPSSDVHDRPWDAARTEKVLPVDFYAGGPEHIQRHHIYARFVTKALRDLGEVSFSEPFPRVRIGGIIVKDGAKMSKSRGNVVTPDDYFESVGADVLRCSLLFAAPWEEGGDFTDSAVAGIERFFAKVWRVVTGPTTETGDDVTMDATVRSVSDAIERFAFNVGIARLMEGLSAVGSQESKRVFTKLLAPFAPHLAEELWFRIGEEGSVHLQDWPTLAREVQSAIVEIPVQVDGKLRATVQVPARATQSEVEAAALAALPVAPDHTRVVYVPGRVVNLVTAGR